MIEKKPYFSFTDSEYQSNGQTFFNNDNFDWIKNLESNFKIIQAEIETFLKTDTKLKPYFATNLVNMSGKWKTSGFYFWGIADKNQCLKCPQTMAILNEIPNLVSVSISIMEPKSEIKSHHGDTDAIYRCHFGLKIPSKLPEAGFEVGKDQKSWEEGKIFIFNDAEKHKAWNFSEERRIILLFDIIRPEFKSQKKFICSKVLSYIVLQKLRVKQSHKLKTYILSEFFTGVFLVYLFLIKPKIKY